MESRRKLAIDNTSWAATSPILVPPQPEPAERHRPESWRPQDSVTAAQERFETHRQAPAPRTANECIILNDAHLSISFFINLCHALLRQSSHNTRQQEHQPDVEERGPAPQRHGEQEEARHRQHELGYNSTHTGATSTLASGQVLHQVLASTRPRQRRPGAIWDKQAGASAPDSKCVYNILNDAHLYTLHLILFMLAI